MDLQRKRDERIGREAAHTMDARRGRQVRAPFTRRCGATDAGEAASRRAVNVHGVEIEGGSECTSEPIRVGETLDPQRLIEDALEQPTTRGQVSRQRDGLCTTA